MKKANKKYLILGIVTTLIVAVVGTTYAYWKGTIRGVGSPMTFYLDEVYVEFTDTTEITSDETVKPGWNATKTFTLENQGTTDYKYNIIIKDLINTFTVENGLQYKITSTNDGYNMEDFIDAPKSNEKTDTILAYNVNIAGGKTQEYTITFRYKNTNSNQSEDMNKTFSGKLKIVEGTSKPDTSD